MARKSSQDYFDPAPGVEELTVNYPFDNELEIFTLRKDMQALSPPGAFLAWGTRRTNQNPGGTTSFYTTDTKFMTLLFAPEKIPLSGAACITELNYTLDPYWPIAFGITPIARKRQFSLIMQNFGIQVIADLYVPEKFADYNLLGIPAGYGAFATRGHSKALDMLDIHYQRAHNIAIEDAFCITDTALKAMEHDPRIPYLLSKQFQNMAGLSYSSRADIFQGFRDHFDLQLNENELQRMADCCACGTLDCFLIYGGGQKVREWAIEKNRVSEHPHVWWFPDAMDVVRVNRARPIVTPSLENQLE